MPGRTSVEGVNPIWCSDGHAAAAASATVAPLGNLHCAVQQNMMAGLHQGWPHRSRRVHCVSNLDVSLGGVAHGAQDTASPGCLTSASSLPAKHAPQLTVIKETAAEEATEPMQFTAMRSERRRLSIKLPKAVSSPRLALEKASPFDCVPPTLQG